MSKDIFNSSEIKNEEIKKKSEQLRARDLDDIRWILSSPKGRRYLWKILSYAGLYKTAYVPKDTNQTHVNLGVQVMGMYIQSDITDADPDAILKMQTEFISAAKAKNKEAQQEDEDD